MRRYPCQLRFRVSDEQLPQIEKDAENAGMSVCAFVRARATGQPVRSRVDAQAMRELNRGIGLFKKTLGELREHPDDPALLPEVRQTLRAIQAATEALRNAH